MNFLKNKSNLFFVLIVSAILIMVTGCGGSDEEDVQEADGDSVETMDPVTLSFADFFPATHPFQEQLIPEWAEAIEEATDGLVQIEAYAGESLLGSGDIYPGIESGIADIGHDVSGYNPGSLPVINSMYLGGIEYQNVEVSSYVARDLIEELQPEELDNTELMFIYGISPGLIMTSEPVETLEDLKGMQIRASGTNVETLEALGATPVSMTITEAYEGMSRGVVDGFLLPPDTLQGFNLAEIVDYVTEVDFIYNTVHYVTMNKEVWDSFPEHIQEAIHEVNEETFLKAVDMFSGLSEGGYEYGINEYGVEKIELSEEESERWKELVEPLIDEHVEELNSQGIDGQEVMDKIQELSDKYNSEFGD